MAELTDEVIDIAADRAQHRPGPHVFVITFHMAARDEFDHRVRQLLQELGLTITCRRVDHDG